MPACPERRSPCISATSWAFRRSLILPTGECIWPNAICPKGYQSARSLHQSDTLRRARSAMRISVQRGSLRAEFADRGAKREDPLIGPQPRPLGIVGRLAGCLAMALAASDRRPPAAPGERGGDDPAPVAVRGRDAVRPSALAGASAAPACPPRTVQSCRSMQAAQTLGWNKNDNQRSGLSSGAHEVGRHLTSAVMRSEQVARN